MEGIKIGNKESKYPIIQGGMGVGVSLHNLAGTVSKEGGIGIISTADIGYKENDFKTNPRKANLRAIEKEIKMARKIAGEDKILGVNIMVAMTHYKEIVEECVKQKIDLIISGAGIPKELPEYVVGTDTKIAPIVSSLRCCELITKHWIKKYNYVPDMIVIEGPEAGGHLGFKKDELIDNKPKLEDITKEVVNYIKEIEKEFNKQIPVISAGGIWNKTDIKRFLNLGASGVQMATRFVATNECDASKEFKEAYVNAKKEDIKIITSPVGMPGRAINNEFIKKVYDTKCQKIGKCYNCIKTCDIKTTPYCITDALINSVKGNVDNGLIFCGSNVSKIDKILSVHDLMQELTD